MARRQSPLSRIPEERFEKQKTVTPGSNRLAVTSQDGINSSTRKLAIDVVHEQVSKDGFQFVGSLRHSALLRSSEDGIE